MESLFELFAWLKVRFAPCGHVYDLARARVASGWFGLGVFYLQNAKSSDLDAIPFNKRISHCLKKAIDHLQGQVVLTTNGIGYYAGEIFFGDSGHR